MVNLERIHKDFARITCDNVDPGVNQWSTWKGSAKTLQGLSLTMLILGGQSMLNLGRICKDTERISANPPRINKQQSPTCCALWVYYNALWVILPPVTHTCMWAFFCNSSGKLWIYEQ